MLDIVRKHASSWIIKMLLGLIVIVFIFFFGFSTLRQTTDDDNTAAIVNGEAISKKAILQTLDAQKDLKPELAQLPPAFLVQFEKQILDQFIRDTVLKQEAHKLGLRISDEEMASHLKDDPNLLRDGKFDLHFYKNKFRPWFQNRYGVDYEKSTSQNLLQSRLAQVFSMANVVVPKEAQKNYELENTGIRVLRLVIDPKKLAEQITPSEEEILNQVEKEKATLKAEKKEMGEDALKKEAQNKLKEEFALKKRDELSQTLWPTFVHSSLNKTLLEANHLNQEEIPFTSIPRASSLLGGEEDHGAQTTLFSLSLERPFPPAPITLGNRIYFFKLLEKKLPSIDDFEKIKQAEMQMLAEDLTTQFFEKWQEEKVSQAKIKVSKSRDGS